MNFLCSTNLKSKNMNRSLYGQMEVLVFKKKRTGKKKL